MNLCSSVVELGEVARRRDAASRAVGWASRVNGRSWSRIGATVVAEERLQLLERGPERLAPSAAASPNVVSSDVAEPVDLRQRPLPERSAAGSSSIVSARFSFWLAKRRKTAGAAVDEAGQLLDRARRARRDLREVRRSRAGASPAAGPPAATAFAASRDSGAKRRKALARSRPPPLPSASTAAGEQQLQVVAGVAVEAGEEVVQVDVGLRSSRSRPWRRSSSCRPGLGRAGIELEHHVLEPGLRPQQQRGVRVDAFAVLLLDVQRRDRLAVDEVDAGDVADLARPETFTAWPWPGRMP